MLNKKNNIELERTGAWIDGSLIRYPFSVINDSLLCGD